MKFVIAGNHEQYKQYLRENQISAQEAIYLHDSYQLRGFREAEIIRTGTWWENPICDDPCLSIIEKK